MTTVTTETTAEAAAAPIRRLRALPLTRHLPAAASAASTGGSDVPLHGNLLSLSSYRVDVAVGTPPRTLSVVPDTRWSLVTVHGRNCRGCAGSLRYSPLSSSTSAATRCVQPADCAAALPAHVTPQCYHLYCGFSTAFPDGGTLQGLLYTDTMEVVSPDGHVRLPGAVVGAVGLASKAAGSLAADGVLGLGGDLVPALADAGALPAAVFSLCFARDRGMLVLGGTDARLHAPAAVTTSHPLLPAGGSSPYMVHVPAVSLGGVAVSLPADALPMAAAVDSAATALFLPTAVLAAVKTAFTTFCGATPDACRNGANSVEVVGETYCVDLVAVPEAQRPATVATFPSLDLSVVHVPPSSLLLPAHWVPQHSHGLYCLAAYDSSSSEAVLGSNVFLDHTVTFDVRGRTLNVTAAAATRQCSLTGQPVPSPTAAPAARGSTPPSTSSVPVPSRALAVSPTTTATATPSVSTSHDHAADSFGAPTGSQTPPTGPPSSRALPQSTLALIAGVLVVILVGVGWVVYQALSSGRVEMGGLVLSRRFGGVDADGAVGAGAGVFGRGADSDDDGTVSLSDDVDDVVPRGPALHVPARRSPRRGRSGGKPRKEKRREHRRRGGRHDGRGSGRAADVAGVAFVASGSDDEELGLTAREALAVNVAALGVGSADDSSGPDGALHPLEQPASEYDADASGSDGGR